MEVDKVFFKIIVPNYNNYIYIKKCLDSILNQTFKDYVCIVVDDLSTDNSPKIAQIYAKRYPDRFKFVQLEKKGYAGAARNRGLDYPTDSEYTWFMDSDDWLYDKDVLQNLYKTVISNKFPDIVRCSRYELGGIPGTRTNKMTYREEYSDIERILKNGGGPAKNLFRSKFKCRFVENRAKNNDMVWFLRLYDQVDIKRICIEKRACYVYNRLSVTSCQHIVDNILNKECTKAERLLISDMLNENFKTDIIRRYVKCSTENRKKWYKDQILIKDFFKNSCMITIDDQKFMKTCEIFQKKFNGLRPLKVYGSHDKKLTGPQNCKQSHINVVKYAKDKNLPFIVVFEDDAYPRTDALERLEEYLYRIPGNSDFIVLGWSNHSSKTKQLFTLPFNRLTSILSGSHSYIIFKSAYDKYLKYMETHKNATADGLIYNNVGNAYVLDRPIFIQYSDSKSMNNHTGYIFYGDHTTPPDGFSLINNI